MAREIKFRVFYKDSDGVNKMSYNWAFEEYAPINDQLNSVVNLMQYTGVNDKNNKEAYEGDIIHCFIDGLRIGDNDTITFKNGSFWLNRRDIPISQWYDKEGAEFEIAGNIYEPVNQ